jgi:hypothetical protein
MRLHSAESIVLTVCAVAVVLLGLFFSEGPGLVGARARLDAYAPRGWLTCFPHRFRFPSKVEGSRREGLRQASEVQEEGVMRTRLMVSVFLGVGLSLSGCQVTGGGWIPSAYDEDEKATFGFVAACVAEPVIDEGDAGPIGDEGGFLVARGQFEYKDHVPVPEPGVTIDGGGGPAPGTIVQLHGTVESAVAIPVDDGDAGDLGDFGGDTGGIPFCGVPADAGLPTIDDGGDEGAFIGSFSGPYEPQPKKIRGVPRATGIFNVFWEDQGEPPGLSDGDTLFIELFGGEFDGYSNGGTLGGGNIEFEFLEPPIPVN